MPYTYLNASLSIRKQPKESLTSDFQSAINVDFKTASDWHIIKRETIYGSATYEDVEVRINRLFDGKTTVSVGDDYKRLLFKSPKDNPQLGSLFHFDNNYWIVTNVESIRSLATTCVIRRCNNTLRWKDLETGTIYSEPCSVDYLIKESRDYSTGGSALVQPSGFIEVISQFNTRTNKIRPSKRFIFGNKTNWNGYKVMGGGVNNFDNRITEDNISVGLVRLSMLANQINETSDDLNNGVADVYENTYTISMERNTLVLNVSESYLMNSYFEINEIRQSPPPNFNWTTSNKTIATVDQNGLITPVSIGSVTITCSLVDNPQVLDTCVVSVVGTSQDNYKILVSPYDNFVYEGEEKIFETSLYIDDVLLPDTFSYTLNSNGISSNKFRYNVLSGNSFWLKNITREDDGEIIVTATSGSHSLEIPIKLKGAW